MDLIETKSETEASNSIPAVPVASVLPVSVIVPVRNEARNLPRCLQSLAGAGEVYVIDSQSSDDTIAIAQSHGAKVVQFYYAGGWPKKRQWAMDTLPLAYDWILLLDADEVLTPELVEEIRWTGMPFACRCIFSEESCGIAMRAFGNCRCSAEGEAVLSAD